MGLVPGARRSKGSVNYRQMEKCGNCVYFYSGGSCKLVTGNIAEDAICTLWSLTEPLSNRAKGGDFYSEEYSKSGGQLKNT
jgi:hypothetical protein